MKKIGKTVAIERNERDEKEPFKGMERERPKEEIKERKGDMTCRKVKKKR